MTDDYKKLGFYESKTNDISNSFGKFSDGDEHYFCYNSDKGYTVLISEGYSSESGRDNGIASVQKNMTNPDRYARKTTDQGKHYFSLRAGNNQEIAMSRYFNSEGEMNGAIGKLTGQGGVIASAGAVDTENITAAGEGYTANFSIAAPAAPTPTDDADKPKKKRKKRTGPKKPKPEKVQLKKGNYLFNNVTYKTFRSGEDKHYFMFNDADDKMLFMTTNLKGFPTEKEVDEALAKAVELAPSEANYEGKVAKNGTYYFYLKDADGKNFGKSFFYKTEEDMRQAVGLLIGRVTGAGAPGGVVDADAEAKAAAAEEARLKAEAKAKAEAEAKAKADAEAKRKADEAARLKAEADAKAKAEADAKRKAEADAEAKRKADEAARLKAEADAKAKAEAEARRKSEEEARLKAEAEAKAEAQKKAAAAAAATAAATALALKQKSEADAKAKEDEERKALRTDDYLPCKDYGGKTGFNKFFNEERSRHYFSYNDRNGNTLLRSEGYESEAARDNGLRAVIKNAPIGEHWKTEVALGKYHYYVLRSANNQEVARSCYYESKDEMMTAYNGVTGENSAVGIGSALVGGKLLSAAMLRRNKQQADAEAARLKAEADAKAKADAEAARLKAEADAKAKADADAARLKAEADAKAKADAEAARLKAEADAKAKADAEAARLKAEADAKAKADADAARLKAEADAKAKADAEAARLKAEQQKKAAAATAAAAAAAASALAFRQKEEADAKAKADANAARLKVEAETKRKADAEAVRVKAEAARRKAEVEATAKRKREAATVTAAASTGGGKTERVTPVATNDGAAAGGCLRKWWWLALLLLLIPILLFLLRGCWGAGAACTTPDVEILGQNNTTTQATSANITADISNVDKENINVTFNNKPINNFTYNEDNDKFGINLALVSGKNTLRINAKNKCGEDTETRTITYQEATSQPLGKNCTDLGFNTGSLSCNMANYMAIGASTFPKMFTFDRSRFGRNSAKMPNAAYRDVDELAALLKAYPNAKIAIHGHIDTNESEACNESYCEGANLSTVRARCVYRKLLDRGISANQMTFKGMGTKAGKKVEIFIQNR